MSIIICLKQRNKPVVHRDSATLPTLMFLQLIVEDLLRGEKRLSQRQMTSLLCKHCSENPLWLGLACDELRCACDDRDTVTQRIDMLPDCLPE